MIALYADRGKLVGSYRPGGKLETRVLAAQEYSAFARDPDALRGFAGIVDRRADFPGWTKLVFTDYDSRLRALEQNPTLLYEADVSPVRRFLSDNKCRIDAPRRVYLDIETDSRVPPRVQVETGSGRILSWALADEEGTNHVGCLEKDSDESEAELLAELWRRMADYDQIAAWFGDNFDFPVINLRTEHLSRFHKKEFQAYWANRRRLLFVDQAACFKRHHMAPESGDDKTSMKLNDVCMSIFKEGKHDFDARKTWEAWAEGGARRREMVAYNLQDTLLLPRLEQETRYLELQQTLGELTLTFVNSHGLKPMPQVDGYLLRKAHLEKTHLPSKRIPTGNEKQYEGAFVLPPQALGVHETVHVCDFASLYPTVIRSLNISPETKGKDGCVAFRTGVKFATDVEGMVPAAAREAMELRKVFKKKYEADPNDKASERKSKAYKIFCNSIYGVMGSAWSRYYDVEIAESITLGAKHLILETQKAAEDRGWRVLYMDTDSLFVTGCTVEEFDGFVKQCNAELYPKMLDEQGCPRERQCVSLSYEKAFKKLIFPLGQNGTPSAKRYFGSYLHFAFKEKKKPEIRGLEYMRGDGARYARHMQKECIELILSGATADDLEKWMMKKRSQVMSGQLAVEDIMLTKGLGQELSQYSSKSPPAHVRLALELEEEGDDVGAGTRISYVITDGRKSPMEVTLASHYEGEFDRFHAWNKQIYPPTMRVLAGAYLDKNWVRFIARRPKEALRGQLGLALT